MMRTMVTMFLNDNTQLHVSILKQDEVEVVDQEDNKHRQIESNKMRDRDTYLEELIVGHHLNISFKKHVIF